VDPGYLARPFSFTTPTDIWEASSPAWGGPAQPAELSPHAGGRAINPMMLSAVSARVIYQQAIKIRGDTAIRERNQDRPQEIDAHFQWAESRCSRDGSRTRSASADRAGADEKHCSSRSCANGLM